MGRLGVDVVEFKWWRVVVGRIDVWHLHWPERYFADRSLVRAVFKTMRLLALMSVAKLRRVRLVWTVHNVRSHEHYHPASERAFWALFVRLLDAFVAISPTSLRLARAEHPGLRSKQTVVSGFGSYESEYTHRPSRTRAREQLGLAPDGPLITTFGQIRSYKGIPDLLAEFLRVGRADARLIIAGRPDSPETDRQIRALASPDPRVQLHLGFQERDVLAEIICASDLVVLPFRSVLHSSSAVLALSLERPVLAPAIGAMPDLLRAVGGRWLRLYEGELTAATLERAVGWAEESRVGPALGSRFRWEAVARRTLTVYR